MTEDKLKAGLALYKSIVDAVIATKPKSFVDAGERIKQLADMAGVGYLVPKILKNE